MWAFLLTDILLYLVLAVLAFYIIRVARQPRLRAPWLQVFSRPMGMVTAVVLLVFLAITVLDSVHYHPARYDAQGEVSGRSTEVISALDGLLSPLVAHDENTYSAPFASFLYTKEMQTLADGSTVFDYPALDYGGQHLASLDKRPADLRNKALKGLLLGTVAGGAVLLLGLGVGRLRTRRPWPVLWQQFYSGQLQLAWRSGWLAVLCLAWAGGLLLYLSHGYHVFGTDQIGQDVLYKTLKSIRTGVLIGTLTTLVMLPFALLLGPMAGYFRGWVDDVIQYIYTVLSSIPSVLLIVAAMLVLQVYVQNHPETFGSNAERADIRLLFLCIILGVTSWSSLCRVLRAETLKLSQVEYVQAAIVMGVGRFRIILRHILPNIMHLVLIQVVLDFSALVLAEAVLSYIGVGVDPNTYSWGNMINSARLELARDPIVWWPLVAAFVFMLTLVLAANLFADTVRDAFDPRLRRGRA